MQQRFIFLSLLVMIVVNCTTTEKVANTESLTNIERDPSFRFTSEEQQQLYLKMIAVQIAQGMSVETDKLHNVEGKLLCYSEGSLENCYLRVRLPTDEVLSSTQEINTDLQKKLISHYRKSRPDLKDQSLVIADIHCNFVGKNAPPFDNVDVACNLGKPKLPNELYVSSEQADRLAKVLASSDTDFSGTLTCLQIGNTPNKKCVMRKNVRVEPNEFGDVEILDTKEIEIDSKDASVLFEEIQTTLKERWAIQTKNGTDNGYKAPSAVSTKITCTEVTIANRKQTECRASF